MCVIVYQPRGANLSRNTLKTCFENNPDGAGYMFSRNMKLQIRKGFFAFRKLWQSYRSDLAQNPESNFVIHCRIATHGKTNNHNCHPFRVGNIGVAHNGILWDMPKNEEASDTAMFCREVLKKLSPGWFYSRGQRILLDNYAAKHSSKFVFMDKKGNVWIANKGTGIWMDGIWYSNSTFAATSYKKYFGFTSSFGEEEETDETLGPWLECHCCAGYFPRVDMVYEKEGVYICKDCMEVIESDGAHESFMVFDSTGD